MGIGKYRVKAAERVIVGGLFLFVASLVIAPLVAFVGIVLAVVDILWQLIFNSEGVAPTNLFTTFYDWLYANMMWTFTGRGEFTLWP